MKLRNRSLVFAAAVAAVSALAPYSARAANPPGPTPQQITDFILGKTTDSLNLDLNTDGKVDVADVIIAIGRQPFVANQDMQLGGGTYTFSDVTITTGVTVTTTGDVTIHSTGNITIDGNLIGGCNQIQLISGGDIEIIGTIDNHCDVIAGASAGVEAGLPTPPDGKDILIQTSGGAINLGSLSAGKTAQLISSGNVNITDNVAIQDSEFAILPPEKSATLLPPAVMVWASSVTDTATPGSPATFSFHSEAVDPDGGALTYQWSFGDGGSSTDPNPFHPYTQAGSYLVTLVVTDDEAQTGQATMRVNIDDSDTVFPSIVAATAQADSLVIPQGGNVNFFSDAVDPEGGPLTFMWDFGDNLTSPEESPTHVYAQPGYYFVNLTIQDDQFNTTIVTLAVYVFPTPPMGASVKKHIAGAEPPDVWVGGIVRMPADANPGRVGSSIHVALERSAIFAAGVTMQAQNGGPGIDRTGSGTVRGGFGSPGGSIDILVRGSLEILGGSFSNGDGGRGGNATATSPPGGMAVAKGGDAGNACGHLTIEAEGGITISGPVAINPGSGGAGGTGMATGGDGIDICNLGGDGGSGKAQGGRGGQSGKIASFNGSGGGFVTVSGGHGGNGGPAIGAGGAGGDAVCARVALGGKGNWANAKGGSGGNSPLANRAGFALTADAFTAGSGGQADATGGEGGFASATAPACAEAVSIGGDSRNGPNLNAFATGGNGGRGRIDGNGANANATGGVGGASLARGGDCDGCSDAGEAHATGGNGGIAKAIKGRHKGPGGADGVSTAVGGDGGDASATGGDVTGQCATCPAGAGGAGGNATATGGDGGNATGDGVKTAGDGGDADSFGGKGGKGSSCCTPTFQQGGNGGPGGDAVSTVGKGGLPSGANGAGTATGGNGGDGGDGVPPGGGGPGGTATVNLTPVPVQVTETPGANGSPGAVCPGATVVNDDSFTVAPEIMTTLNAGANDTFPQGAVFMWMTTPPASEAFVQTFPNGTFTVTPTSFAQSFMLSYEIMTETATSREVFVNVFIDATLLTNLPGRVDVKTQEMVVDVPMLGIVADYYPVYQFILANNPGDVCGEAHWHKHAPGMVYPLIGPTGPVLSDPNPTGCGFGKLSNLMPMIMTVPQSTYQAFLQAHPPGS